MHVQDTSSMPIDGAVNPPDGPEYDPPEGVPGGGEGEPTPIPGDPMPGEPMPTPMPGDPQI